MVDQLRGVLDNLVSSDDRITYLESKADEGTTQFIVRINNIDFCTLLCSNILVAECIIALDKSLTFGNTIIYNGLNVIIRWLEDFVKTVERFSVMLDKYELIKTSDNLGELVKDENYHSVFKLDFDLEFHIELTSKGFQTYLKTGQCLNVPLSQVQDLLAIASYLESRLEIRQIDSSNDSNLNEINSFSE